MEAVVSSSDMSVEQLSINTIRTLAIDAVQKANSGHPGLPMGAAPMAYVLWQNHLRHNPSDPHWPNRDRFVLSAGHGSMLLYCLLHLYGYDMTMDDLRAFRQWKSRTPGHPETLLTPGIEATTGPLGQGTANAVGMAMAERFLAHTFNRPGHTIVDHHTYSLVSDGDLMEGISGEAGSLAGHLKLGKLIYLYDSNNISLDGPTSLAFSTENVSKRYEAYGWQVLQVDDGDTNLNAIDAAITQAKTDATRPSLILIKTTIGYGAPNKQGTSGAHGSPLGSDEIALAKKTLGWDPEKSFFVPDKARSHFNVVVERGKRLHDKWKQQFLNFSNAHPHLAKDWAMALAGELPLGWDSDLPTWNTGEKLATRQASGEVLNAIASKVPWLLGGDADISSSTNTMIKDAGNFNAQTGEGRNIHYGVREHAMGAIANGMAYHAGVRSFVATFFCFSDYMRPSARLAALDKLPVIFVWTHDSIGLGEDGPTHQPVEHLMSLRAIPNFTVVRPCDANETAEAWKFAMNQRNSPVALILSRQGLPVLYRANSGPATGLARGAYTLIDAEGDIPQAIIIGTGSEVSVAVKAQSLLAKEGFRVRVVSMPCWEAFDAQSNEYQESVLPTSIKARVSIEAGITFGWNRWIGDAGIAIGIDTFGASAPGPTNMEKFGLTADQVAEAVRKLV
tara:strand:+ start:938 stop:2962 length:2025 start_codon:yes stop_codon:yes gene_type:complete